MREKLAKSRQNQREIDKIPLLFSRAFAFSTKRLGGRIAGVTQRPDYRPLGDYFHRAWKTADGFSARKRNSRRREKLPVLSGERSEDAERSAGVWSQWRKRELGGMVHPRGAQQVSRTRNRRQP